MPERTPRNLTPSDLHDTSGPPLPEDPSFRALDSRWHWNGDVLGFCVLAVVFGILFGMALGLSAGRW